MNVVADARPASGMATSQKDSLLETWGRARSMVTDALASNAEAGEANNAASQRARLARGLSGVSRGLNSLLDAQNNPGAGPSAARQVPSQSEPPMGNDGDKLPGYNRRDPRAASVGSRMYTYQDKSGKLEVSLAGAGQAAQNPLFVKDIFDTIRGVVTVNLEKPEAITSLKVWVPKYAQITTEAHADPP
jgi:hypothetical protein